MALRRERGRYTEVDMRAPDLTEAAHRESLRRASLAYTSTKCRRAVREHVLGHGTPFADLERERVFERRKALVEQAKAAPMTRSEAAKLGAKKRTEIYNAPASVTFDGACIEAESLRGAFRLADVPLLHMQIYYRVIRDSGCAVITYREKAFEFRLLAMEGC